MVVTTKRGRQSKRKTTAVKTSTVPSTCPLPSPPTPNTSQDESTEDPCPICKVHFWVKDGLNCIQCDKCYIWVHSACEGLSDTDLKNIPSETPWYCHNCSGVPDFKPVVTVPVAWGEHTEATLPGLFLDIHSKIAGWKHNLFRLPAGAVGKAFICEATRLINGWVTSSPLEPFAITALHVMGALLLQKPGKRSKSYEETEALKRRLELWKAGQFEDLVREGKAIQSKIPKCSNHQNTRKSFSRLMMNGRVAAALRVLNTSPSAPLDPTPEVIEALRAKHPPAQPLNRALLVSHEPPPAVEPALFDSIDTEAIRKSAATTKGGAGPSGMTDALWARMLCSKSFRVESDALAHAVARMTRRLCSTFIDPHTISTLVSCRLIALNKNPGIRPIGVGEILRRIIGRTVVSHLSKDIVHAAGPLQLASGLQGGIEAAVHSMSQFFSDDGTEGVLLADATNAFNVLNRATALVNIRHLCPPLSILTINIYRMPAKLFLQNGTFILSSEGTTQGCNLASPWYCISLRPLITALSDADCSQIFFADDGASVGKILALRKWWDILCKAGPGLGYFPNGKKSVLIVKPGNELTATTIFEGTGVQITSEGQRYLGAPLGTTEFKQQYVKTQVEVWAQELSILSDIATSEPHTSFAAFTVGLSKRWLFLMRTTPGISELFQPLENNITNLLLPNTISNQLTPDYRKLLSLPARDGGLGIFNPVEVAETEYTSSTNATAPLSKLINEQKTTFDSEGVYLLEQQLKHEKAEMLLAKRDRQKKDHEEVVSTLTSAQQRFHQERSRKGASIWVTSLPLKEHGFNFNKREFRDAMSLRYGFELEDRPHSCPCGKINTTEHCLTCPLGGYVQLRHNEIRDLTANLLRESGCLGVSTEPHLLPITGEKFRLKSTNTKNDARLDVAATGFWSDMDKIYTDVRIFNPLAPTNCSVSLDDALKRHEQEKKRCYNERVLEVEQASFCPLVFSVTGAMGNEAEKFYRHLAHRLSKKTHQTYPHTMRYIRQRISFTLLRTAVISLRGHKGTKLKAYSKDINDFNLLYI